MLSRRESLRVLAGTVGAWTLGGAIPLPAETPHAVLAPEQEEGPFYIKAAHLRRDIREGRPGIPLDLRIKLVDLPSDEPLAHAAVDIWHCDAAGIYSGFAAMSGPPPGADPGDDDFDFGDMPPGTPPDFHGGPGGGGPPHHAPVNSSRFLRGVQMTNANGEVRFTTIYPGWYAGREIHIHLKVRTGGAATNGVYAAGHVCHTGQIFFPDETNAIVSHLQPYATSTTHRTTKTEDHVFQDQNGKRSIATMSLPGATPSAGYVAAITLAVNSSATPGPVGFR